MKDGAVVHNPEFDLIWFSGFNGEDIQACLNLVQWFQRRRVKCEKNGRQMTVADHQAMTNT